MPIGATVYICAMKQILLLGAGKSSTVLITYLLNHAEQGGWQLTVADTNLQSAMDKIRNAPLGRAAAFDVTDEDARRHAITGADIVISMLPPRLHAAVARDCLRLSKHLLTASYVDDEMKSMASDIEEKDLLFLCEMGLDPGIDHMSAMKLIDAIHAKGGRISSFISHCGGLVAPESDDNPWHYKISWNPRNIILAGKAGAVYKKNGAVINLPYEEIFAKNETVEVQGLDRLAWYPNRDSLSYITLYGLEEADTFLRTTLRYPEFCKAWNCVVNAKLTDEDRSSPVIANKHIRYHQWLEKSIEQYYGSANVDRFLARHVDAADIELVRSLFDYLGLFSNEPIPLTATCSADVLQFAAENRLALLPHDKDMIVMMHELSYDIDGRKFSVTSSLVVKGENNLNTAMATTVGLPIGIAARLLLNGTIRSRGLRIPTAREIYVPVLQELASQGISFVEREKI